MAGRSMRRTCGWCLSLTACVLAPADDGSQETSSTSSSSDDGHSSAASTSGPGTAPSTSGVLDESSTTTSSDPTTGSTVTSSETSITAATESSSDDGASTGATSPDPIVLVIASTTTNPGEVSAFDELEHFVGEYDEEICNAAPPCGDNTAPQLEPAIFWVNGAQLDDPSEIAVGDRVGLLFPFADPECNVACGGTNSEYEAPFDQAGGGGSSDSNFPCDTASTDVYLGFDFYEVDDPGDYVINFLRLTDVCGADGSQAAEFTVPP